jgi:CspA family cold shock protein
MFERRPGFFRAEDGQPAGRRVEATVKWFNPTKGFGFVSVPDGSPDAFLPMAALRRAGHEDVREGVPITCEIGAGAKGPLVVNVLSVGASSGAPAPARAAASAGAARPGGQSMSGAVKWFEPLKGYGFIAPDGGGKDIFIHVTALRRSGVEALGPGQRVRVDVVDGKKGLEADKVTLI